MCGWVCGCVDVGVGRSRVGGGGGRIEGAVSWGSHSTHLAHELTLAPP